MAKEKEPDSVTHTRERRAKMQAESDKNDEAQAQAEVERQLTQEERDRKTRMEEDQMLTQHANLIKDGETREQLLDRIREMRENPPKEPAPTNYLTDSQREQTKIEQDAGAAAVKKAEEELERNRETRRKAEEEQAKREGSMNPVHHPNPGMDEQYPAEKATLGKTKK